MHALVSVKIETFERVKKQKTTQNPNFYSLTFLKLNNKAQQEVSGTLAGQGLVHSITESFYLNDKSPLPHTTNGKN